jgi:hypothetical protein
MILILASVLFTTQINAAPSLVTPDNFNRAESDFHFQRKVDDGMFGKIVNIREPASKVRDGLLLMGSTLADSKRMFGDVGDVDPVRHLIGTAGGFGGNPEQDAIYLNVTPVKNDGSPPYVLKVQDVPVDGFWSVSVYNAAGYFEKNEVGAYSFNNITAKKDDDGGVTINFGGDPKQSNYIAITKGWNYTVRLYRPRKEIIDGNWTFPQAQAAK